jgi:hypothetical protein
MEVTTQQLPTDKESKVIGSSCMDGVWDNFPNHDSLATRPTQRESAFAHLKHARRARLQDF